MVTLRLPLNPLLLLVLRKKSYIRIRYMAYPSSQEAETGRSQIPDWPGLHSKVVFQTKLN